MQANHQQPSRSFMSGACEKCGGDGFLDQTDGPEWRCLQCGRPIRAAMRELAVASSLPLPGPERRYLHSTMRNIGSGRKR
jgi:PHP family Zn ribbon phosphoesterase